VGAHKTMSDLLAIKDYDSEEFIDRLAGLFTHCGKLATRAETLHEQTQARIAGMKRHTFEGLAEIGEALLLVQEARPGEFAAWFEAHEERLGFSLSHANQCKAAAKLVREHGSDQAYELSTAKAQSSSTPPTLSLTVRLTKPLEQLDAGERAQLRKRLEPAVEIHHRLEAIEQAQTSLCQT
jgi:hypothetical protein